MKIRSSLVWALATLALGVTWGAEEELLRLPIGDPARKDHAVEVVLDGIVDAHRGDLIAPADLPTRLDGVRLVFVGESHTSMDYHQAQLRVIDELQRAGRRVLIGLEMYPYTEQRFLDQWVDGLLTEEGFLELSDWYENWGYHWDYYRAIFLYARQNRLPMYALNTPREVVKAVREKGIDNLTEDERQHVPETIDTDHAEHFRLFRAFFGDDDEFHNSMSDEQWRGMFDAQCTWEATMGHNAVQGLRRHDDGRSIMVVLIGSGHVAYGLGIQRQAALAFDGGMASILPVHVPGPCDERPERVQASYADFVWGVPPESQPLYPFLGVSTVEADDGTRRKVIHVAEDSPAAHAGLQLGDVLLALDGIDVPDRRTMNRLVAGKRWGDAAQVTVQRDGRPLTLRVEFRRPAPEPCEKGS